MSPHLLLVYQFLIIALGIASFTVVLKRAKTTGRDDQIAFAQFWGVFTLWLFMGLVKEYLFLNVEDLSAQAGLLLYALDTDLSFVTIAVLLRYLHLLLDVKGRKTRNIIVLIALFISIVSISPPWGVRVIARDMAIEFLTGIRIGLILYIIGLAYGTALAWLAVFRKDSKESLVFLVVLAVFGSTGLTETLWNFVAGFNITHLAMGPGGILYSTLPYAVYGVFLISYFGRESTRQAISPGDDMPGKIPELSDREQEVVRLVLLGYGNAQIADELFISLSTVKTHLYRIYKKTGVSNRFGLMQAGRGSAETNDVPGDNEAP